MTTFYRHFWLSRYGYTTNKKLVSEFNKKIDKDVKTYEAFINDLDIAATDYAKIVSPKESDWAQPEDKEVYQTLEALNIFNVTQVRIILLGLFDAKRRNIIKHKVFLSALSYLQYFHFVFNAICSERPSNLERKYASISKKLHNSSSKEESARCVKELQETLDELLPDYRHFEQGFQQLYFTEEEPKDKKVVQYVLKKLERYSAGTDEMRPDSFTIEHIMPESDRIEPVGRIGNLLPLGEKINGAIGTKPFKRKLERYKTSQYNAVQRFVQLHGEQDDWTVDDIDSRTKELAKIMYYQNNLPEAAPDRQEVVEENEVVSAGV